MQLETALDYEHIPLHLPQKLHLLVQLLADSDDSPVTKARPPIHLSIAIDRSGSMQGAKLQNVKAAAQLIPNYLSAQDAMSLVAYDNVVEVVMSPRPGIDKDYMRYKIEGLAAMGSTNLSGGWLQACQLVAQGLHLGAALPELSPGAEAPPPPPSEKSLTAAALKRVFLLTDGIANVGVVEPDRLGNMAAQKFEEGIVTNTIGVGLDFNEDLLVRMAREGGGDFYFIDSPDQAAQIFQQMLGHLAELQAQNLQIRLEFLGEARLLRQVSHYPEQEGSYRLGDMSRDERKALLLELALPAQSQVGRLPVAKLRLEYDDLSGQGGVQHRILEQTLSVTVGSEVDEEQVPHSQVTKTRLRLEARQARQTAIQEADRRRFQTAKDLLSRAADAIEAAKGQDPTLRHDRDLQLEHDMLREDAVNMGLGEQRYDAYERKSQTSQIYRRQTEASEQTASSIYYRMKESRPAIERQDPPPSRLKWGDQELALGEDDVSIGKADDNTIIVAEESVSRHHCRVVKEGGEWVLYDTSSNGTFANGGRVEGRFRLSAGDVVTVGSVLFRFEA
jgi:Ca-activated chloride channel family protein